MHILINFAHPLERCFCRKLLQRTEQELLKQNHTVEIADLYAENFPSAMQAADFAQFEQRPMPKRIQQEQTRIEQSDGLVFIFPVWWWSMPGILKGWIDRVMSYGWAWMDPMDPSKSPLQSRPILVMAAAGASADAFRKRGYDVSMDTQLRVGTWSYCGFNDVTTQIFHDLHSGSPLSLGEDYLNQVGALCSAAFGGSKTE